MILKIDKESDIRLNPKISIVTPSFNQGNFLEETIDSVLSQDYSNLEYIIIDGGSSDQSVSIIKKYEKYLKYWASEPDNGQSDAILKGLQHCAGDVFNWLNSDDKLVEGALSIIAKYFEENRGLQVISGYEIHSDGQNEELKSGTRLEENLERSVVFAVIYQPSTFWKLSTFRAIGLDASLHFLMDTDIWIRFLLQYGTDHYLKINEPIAKFRLHNRSKTVALKNKFFEERWLLRKRLLSDNLNQSIDDIISTIAANSGPSVFNYKSPLLNMKYMKFLIYMQLLVDLTDLGKLQEARKVFYDGLSNGFWNKSFLRTGIRSHFPFLSKVARRFNY